MLVARSFSRLNVVRAGARSTSVALNISTSRCKSSLAVSPRTFHSTLLRQTSPSNTLFSSRFTALRWQSSDSRGPQIPENSTDPSAISPQEQKTLGDDTNTSDTLPQQEI